MANDYNVYVGLHDKDLVSGLNKALTLVEKFGESADKYTDISVKVKKETLKKAVNDYKSAIDEISKYTDKVYGTITSSKGSKKKIEIIPENGIKDIDQLEKALRNLRKTRESVYQVDAKTKENSIVDAKSVDNYIAKMEIALRAVKTLKSEVTNLSKAPSINAVQKKEYTKDYNTEIKNAQRIMSVYDGNNLGVQEQQIKRIIAAYKKLIELSNTKSRRTKLFEAEETLSNIRQSIAAQKKAEQQLRLTEAAQKKLNDTKARAQQLSNYANSLTGQDVGSLTTKRTALKKLITEYQKLERLEGKSYATEISKSTKEVDRLTNSIRVTNGQANSMTQKFMQLNRIIGSYFSVFAVAHFGKKIAETTGYFEQQRVALQGIIQDATKANTIYNQIKDFSVKSPFEFKDLVTYTKQLSAFQVPYEELFDTTKRLADISAGLGVDMSRIILAFGQVRSASVLRGQELRQFTEAGIPLVEELAKRFTDLEGRVVTTGDVFERISKRGVSFEMVRDILFDMTEEGGKFNDMQEKISKTVYGQIINLKDASNIAMNDIGTSANGLINWILNAMRAMLINWRTTFGSIIGAVTGFKLQSSVTKAFKDVNADAKATGVTLTFWNKSLSVTKRMFAGIGAFFKANWFGLVLSSVSALIGYFRDLNAKAKELKNELNGIDRDFGAKAQNIVFNFKELADKAVTAANGSKEQKDALNKLKTTYADYLPQQDLEIENLKQLAGGYDTLTTAILAKIEADKLQAKQETVMGKVSSDIEKASGTFKKQGIFSKMFTGEKMGDFATFFNSANDELIDILQKRVNDYLTKNINLSQNELRAGIQDIISSAAGKSITGSYHTTSIDPSGVTNYNYGNAIDDAISIAKKTLNANQDILNPNIKDEKAQAAANQYLSKNYDLMIDFKTKYIEMLNEQEKLVQEIIDNAKKEGSADAEKLKNMNDISRMQGYINQLKIYGYTLSNDELKKLEELKKGKDGLADTKGFVSFFDGINKRIQESTANANALQKAFANVVETLNQKVVIDFPQLKDYEKDVNKYISSLGIGQEQSPSKFKDLQFISSQYKMLPNTDYNDYTKKIQNEYDASKSFLKTQKNKKSDDPAIQKQIDDANATIEAMKKIADLINYDIEPDKGGGTRIKTDPMIAVYQKRFQMIKEAYNAEQQMRNLVSRPVAKKTLGEMDNKGLGQFFDQQGTAKNKTYDKTSVIGNYDLRSTPDTKDIDWVQLFKSEIEKLNAIGTDEAKKAANNLSGEMEKFLSKDELSERIDKIKRSVEDLNRAFDNKDLAKSYFEDLINAGANLTDAARIAMQASNSFDSMETKSESLKQKLSERLSGAGYEDAYSVESNNGMNDLEQKMREYGDTQKGKDLSVEEQKQAQQLSKDVLDMIDKLRSYYREETKEIIAAYTKFKKYDAERDGALSKSTRELMKLTKSIQMKKAEIDKSNLSEEEKETEKKKLDDLGETAIKETARTNRDTISKTNYEEFAQDDTFANALKNIGDISFDTNRRLLEKIEELIRQAEETGNISGEQLEQLRDMRGKLQSNNTLNSAGYNLSEGFKMMFGGNSKDYQSYGEELKSVYKNEKALESAKSGTYSSEEEKNKAIQNAEANLSGSKLNLSNTKDKMGNRDAVNASEAALTQALISLEMAINKEKELNKNTEATQEEKEAAKGETAAAQNEVKRQSKASKNAFQEEGVKKFKSGLDDVNSVFGDVNSSISAATSLVKTFTEITSELFPKSDNEKMEEFSDFAGDIGDVMGQIIPVFVSIISLVYTMVTAFVTAETVAWPLLIIMLALISAALIIAVVIAAIRKHDRDLEKEIDNLNDNIEDTENKIKNLEAAMELMAGSDAWESQGKKLALLKQEAKDTAEIAEKEREMKQQDKDAIYDAEQNEIEAKQAVLDYVRELRDEIVGTADDLASTLGNAFIDAFAEGKNAARAWSDAVNDYIGDMLKNLLFSKLIAPEIQSIFDQIEKESGMANSGSPTQALYDYLVDEENAESLASQLYGLGTNFEQFFSALPETLQDFLTGAKNSGELSGGIESVTEDTSRRLEAILNTVMGYVLIQTGATEALSESVTNYMPQIQSQLVKIESNTYGTMVAVENMLMVLNAVSLGTKKLNVICN